MNNEKYRREFINLKEEDPGFNILNKDPVGSCKFEKIFNKVKFKIYIYNLKRNTDNEDYNIYLINSEENNNFKLGSLDIDKYGRGEFKYEQRLDDSETDILQKFDAVAVVLNKKNSRLNNFSIPLVGYMNNERVEYRRSFYSNNNKVKSDVKKFHVDLEKLEQENNDKEIKNECNEDEYIDSEDQELEQENVNEEFKEDKRLEPEKDNELEEDTRRRIRDK